MIVGLVSLKAIRMNEMALLLIYNSFKMCSDDESSYENYATGPSCSSTSISILRSKNADYAIVNYSLHKSAHA